MGFDKVLKDCGFSRNQVAVAKAVVFGCLISPGSERHTIEWFQKRSALSELPGADVTGFGKDVFYEIGDKLYENKDQIEAFLFQRQQHLFPHTLSLPVKTNAKGILPSLKQPGVPLPELMN